MRILYHFPFCPFSRTIRLALAEKKLDFSLEEEIFWKKRPEFLKLNPAGQVPVLVDLNGYVISNSIVIQEYLEESYPHHSLLGKDLNIRNEVRRLCLWFSEKFAREVSLPFLEEKYLGRFQENKGPNSQKIRDAKNAIHYHLEYIAWLSDRRNWLGGDSLSFADLAAASHLSIVDYFGEVPWNKHTEAKNWYVRIKSRPSFRHFLAERLSGIQPDQNYEDLDF